MSEKEQLKKLMEKNFKKALELLGNSTNMKDVHKAYGLLFDGMQIYNYLKENENE